ncbi:MAG: hypothetical protein WB710_19735 [Stellaceae bacterium]
MDRSSALARLATLTGGLTPTGATPAEDLQSARQALAASLLHHALDPTVATAGLPAAPSRSVSSDDLAELGGLLDQAAAEAPIGPAPLVLPRGLPAIAPGNPTLTPAAVAGMQPQSLGPFVDQLGALRWFDLFPAVQQVGITRLPATAPFLLLPLAPPAGPLPLTLPVGAGSLWIEAQLLAPGTPAGSYTGIKISGGSLSFSIAASTGVGGLQVAAATTLTLTVKPDSPAGPLGGGLPGADGGAVVAELPAEVTFVFTQAGAQITAAGNASLTAYGSTVALHWQPGAPVYEAALAQILVPLSSQVATFAPANVLSTLFQPAGAAPIQIGAWALPVAVAAPTQLGTAATAGMLALVLRSGLRATWPGLSSGPADFSAAFLLGAGGVLALLGSIGGASRLGTSIELWQNAPAPSTARSSIDLTFAKGEVVYYASIASYAGASHVEIMSCGASLAAHIDRPLAADGSRLGPSLPGTLAIFETPTLNEVLVFGQAAAVSAPPPPIALSLHNALLVTTPPTVLIAAGSFTSTPVELDSGGLLLSFGLETLLPTLPDPYAANFLPLRRAVDPPAAAGSSQIIATVLWSPTTAVRLGFSDASITAQNLRIAQLAASPTPPPAGQTGEQDQTRRIELTRLFQDSLGSANPSLFLLDVSGNADQFGVGMAVPQPAGAAPSQTLSINGLDLVAPCLDLRVLTAPAVQWEPVVTIQNPNVLPFPFPSPAGFLDDGGPTLIGAADVTLVPVAPGPLLDQVVSAYDGGAAGAAMFTLPFGMVAVATLPQRPRLTPPLFRRPGLAEVRPAFAPQNMTGGRQVSLTVAASFLQSGGGTPGLPGAAAQLRNLVDQNGNPATDQGGNQLSVLGPAVDQPFNLDFAPGSKTAPVPVTRIDLSGYGASSFSAWADPAANPPAVVQVRFNLMVGRASHEVVQIKSILYPWGAIVVRTITIDRQDGSEIYRYDSGWVAATPGTFDIAGITVHPGAVLGAYNIREIRDTTQTYQNGPVELTAVYFDADIQIAGVVSGAINGLVPSTGQLGFVQTAPQNTPLQPSDLAALIASQGALGGPVDCVIAVGGTAQTMRLARVEVANAPHGAVPEFAAAARGSLVLPAQGSWSMFARTDTVSEPTPIDPDLGVPLIRQGPAGSPPPGTPWRLAEPVDLWLPDAPSMDYCLLHSTDSTRLLFARPQIGSGAAAFSSDQTPLLADGFALLDATGICPRQDACLAFPNANYLLEISGNGAFTLTNVPAPFPPTLTSRTLASSTAATIAFEYADAGGTPSQISVSITPSAWSVGIEGVNVRLDFTPFSGLMRTVGDLLATSDSGVNLANAKLVLGSVLQPLQDLLKFLEELGLPDPLSTVFSNAGWTESRKYKLKAGLQFGLPSPLLPALTPLLDTPLGSLTIMLKTGVGNTASSAGALLTSSAQWIFYFTFAGNVQVPVFPLVKAGGLVGFGLEVDFPAGTTPQSEKLTFQLGVIISVGGDIVPGVLKLQASVAFAFKLVVVLSGSTSVSVGVGLILSGSGQILDGLVGISFTAEADGLITVTTPRAVQATFDIQVDVSLCWFLDVNFDVQTQYTKTLA